METILFIHGIIIGIALAAPVGPIALICVRRTLANGRMHGIISGMGVATADIVYAAVTAFGFALISEFLLARQWFFRLFGGIALIAVGIRIFLRVPPDITTPPDQSSYFKDFASMFALAIANPLTILFFTIVIPAFGVVISGDSVISPAIFIIGVFFGEAIWWIFLCGSLGTVRTYLNRAHLHLINRLSGMIIAGFGVVMILSLIFSPSS
jgi:threonine/homoserine/homoserine lactone efflux protein